MVDEIDVHSRGRWPSNMLSNFYPHEFMFDGVLVASMEGLLHAFTWTDPGKQLDVVKLSSSTAKSAGNPRWKDEQSLYWQGQVYNRHEKEYQLLLDRAYSSLFINDNFRDALKATGNKTIRHHIGNHDPYYTILTEYEFCSRLMLLRSIL